MPSKVTSITPATWGSHVVVYDSMYRVVITLHMHLIPPLTHGFMLIQRDLTWDQFYLAQLGTPSPSVHLKQISEDMYIAGRSDACYNVVSPLNR